MSKPYAIFGAGLSGQAARRLAHSQGIETVLIDEAGQGDRSHFEAADLADFGALIFSPGFAQDHPWRVLAAESDVACWSEMAFAARYWQGAMIAVTGTNGKSTLTALLDTALRLGGYDSVAAGNIGYPLSDAALSASNRPGSYAVLEISSFQAELVEGMQLDALVWTNFAEDHLDRYANISDYFDAKANLFDCLKPGAACVVGAQVADWMERMQRPFEASTIAIEDATLVLQLASDSVFHCFPSSENFSLAAELWWWLEMPTSQLIAAANTFKLAPHRLSVVCEREGVRFWDDSKATNFHATLAALEAVPSPIVWIGGGRAKGGDVDAFCQDVALSVEAAVVYGEVAERLAAGLQASLGSVHVHSRFEDAVVAAAELASRIPRANVVLSPGFSSFDQYTSYAERGKSFIDTVLSLKRARKPS
ncbi:UDP-N-acetylmuramoyl-L-alanine--D-glutamate ligase [Coraliomargarita sp. SDUM461004]|uniref:UDP-N-acetylmuramoylalanine--D-glutamate ligase n=1 Tax=Thalassobacterium sedimentorum TaxID=3041258 RepID=A0ABU1APD1_9BACT|nr:UDP-N-acetylmuramoyl-L-alanine--D-glutamate ligase [Coraliomargarita sp. SDUM461004]MDQ8195606.1 UDP-N-acetylmuramoyl-L-alanine--D-glutamate ligase [Coraliomargarita sp. SDUM461004]